MNQIQDLLATILLGIWTLGSIALVLSYIRNLINDYKKEQQEAKKAMQNQASHDMHM